MKNKLTFNIATFSLIYIFILTLINDYITYAVSVLPYFVSLIISTIIVTGISYLLIKKKIIEVKRSFQKIDIIYFSILLCVFAISVVFPDIMFDTINYHIYLQENPFNNKITFDFFPGKNINSFSYAFPDRIHYIFRSILGFRLGLIANYIVLAVVYYQVKDILKKYIKSKNELIYVIFGILTTFSFAILELADNYYIDLFSLVVLLEIIKRILTDEFVVNNKYISSKVLYLAMLFGFAIAIKISNGPILIFLLLYFLVKTKFNFKKVKGIDYPLIILFGLAPFIVYFIYTFIATGNPVFPFYNTIFKSDYFPSENWMDTRFGPHRIREKLLWPLSIILYPERGVDQAIVEYMWMPGHFLSIIIIGYNVVRKALKKIVNKELVELSLITFAVSLIWSNMLLGYTRYGLVVLVLSYIIFFIVLYNLFVNQKYILTSILVLFLINNFIYCGFHFAYSKEWWITNNKFNQDRNPYYKENLKRLFDYDIKYDLPENSVWLVAYYNAGYITMINNDDKIIGMNSSIVNDKTQNIFNDLTKDKRLFVVTDVLNFKSFLTTINNNGYHIINIHDTIKPKFMRFGEQLYIFEVEKNNVQNVYDSYNTTNELVLDNNYESMELIYGLPINHYTFMNEGYNLKISTISKDKETIIDMIELNNEGKYLKYSINNKFNKNDTIKFEIVDKNGKSFLDDRWFDLLNIEFTNEVKA